MTTTPETTVKVREFRQNLSLYLRQASQGAEFVITSRGEELARIVPPTVKHHPRRNLIGLFQGQVQMAPDFDDTPVDLISAMEGRNG